MQDYEFGSEAPKTSNSNKREKIDWDAITLKTKVGDNKIKIVSMAGKKSLIHWAFYATSGKKVLVRCAGEGCPICVGVELPNGEKVPGQKPRANFILKVIDRVTQSIKMFEFSKQIKEEIDRLSANLKKEKDTAQDSLSQYEISIERGPEGANPLYHVNLLGKNKLSTAKERYEAENDVTLIAADTLVIEDIIKPWTAKRIREQIFGIDENGGKLENKNDKKGEQKPDDTSFNFGANEKKEEEKKTETASTKEKELVKVGGGIDVKDIDFLETL